MFATSATLQNDFTLKAVVLRHFGLYAGDVIILEGYQIETTLM